MTRIRASLAAAILTVAGLATAAPPPTAPPADPLGPLAGTWGLPPADDLSSVIGSYLAVYRGDGGKTYTDLFVDPGEWHCSLETKELAWNAGRSRFEWPNGSASGKGKPCWMMTTPRGDKLDLKIWCPWECTDGERVHEVTLERIADVRLTPPVDTVHKFCSSHDPLRQQFCLPGPLQDAVARVLRAAEMWDVLADRNAATSLGIRKVMLDVLENCHARGGDKGCLLQAMGLRAEELEAAVASRQASLAKERRASESAVVSLVRDDQRRAWEGTRYMVNDEMIGTLAIEGCDEKQCQVLLEGTTNYDFGADRRGQCLFGYADKPVLRYLDANRAFAYLEPDEDHANAEGAGPFANFCRIDLDRVDEGIRVRWRGAGCELRCMEAPGEKLSGDYHPLQEPSYLCASDLTEARFDESLPCLDPELARLDRELASAYEQARAEAKGASREKLVRAQRAWLRARREECEGGGERRTCLVQAYRKRLGELTAR